MLFSPRTGGRMSRLCRLHRHTVFLPAALTIMATILIAPVSSHATTIFPERDGFVFVAGGEYELGDARGRYDERPVVTVRLSPFWMRAKEVSNTEFGTFVRAARYTPRGPWMRGFPAGGEVLPVRYVTWLDAAAYAEWAGCELPTEAQWSAAAAVFIGGDQASTMGSSAVGPGPVGTSTLTSGVAGDRPDRKPQVMHLLGNVREWTADWYDRYAYKQLSLAGQIVLDPTGPEDGASPEERFIKTETVAGNERSTRKVVRGGSWAAQHLDHLRPERRTAHSPPRYHNDLGVRCVKAPTQGTGGRQ